MAAALPGLTLARLLEWLCKPSTVVGERHRRERPPQMVVLWPVPEGQNDQS